MPYPSNGSLNIHSEKNKSAVKVTFEDRNFSIKRTHWLRVEKRNLFQHPPHINDIEQRGSFDEALAGGHSHDAFRLLLGNDAEKIPLVAERFEHALHLAGDKPCFF